MYTGGVEAKDAVELLEQAPLAVVCVALGYWLRRLQGRLDAMGDKLNEVQEKRVENALAAAGAVNEMAAALERNTDALNRRVMGGG